MFFLNFHRPPTDRHCNIKLVIDAASFQPYGRQKGLYEVQTHDYEDLVLEEGKGGPTQLGVLLIITGLRWAWGKREKGTEEGILSMDGS